MLIRYLVFFAIIFSFFNSQASSFTWNGSTDNKWGEPTNWTPNGIPGAGDDVLFSGNGIQPVLQINRTITNLEVSGGTVDLGGNKIIISGNSNIFSGGAIQNGTIEATSAGGIGFQGTTFNCLVDVVSGLVGFHGSTFNDSVYIEKTANVDDNGNGGNTFNSPVFIVNSSLNKITFGNVSADNFNAPFYFSNTTSGEIRFGEVAGVNFNAGSKIESVNFSAGHLVLSNCAYAATADRMHINGTGSSTIWLWVNSEFNAPLDIESGGVYSRSCTYNDSLTILKTYFDDNHWYGDNIFNGPLTINNQSGADITFGNSAPDTLNNDFLFSITSDGMIKFGNTAAGATYFGTGGKIKQSGLFTDGVLAFSRFEQASNQKIKITGSGGSSIWFVNQSNFISKVEVEAGNIYTNNSTFADSLILTKTEFNDNTWQGGNMFNGPLVINNPSSADILTGNTLADTLNSDLVFSMSGNSRIIFGYSSGSAYLAPGGVIKTTSFTGGVLGLHRFRYASNERISLTGTGASQVNMQFNSEFDASIDLEVGSAYCRQSVFNDSLIIVKNYNLANSSYGGNTFNGFVRIVNNSSNEVRFANFASDDFNNNVELKRQGTGSLNIAYTGTTTVSGNIGIAGTSRVFSGNGGGTLKLDGTTDQSLDDLTGSSVAPNFRRLTINKSAGIFDLNMPLIVGVSLTLTDGNIETTEADLLTLNDGAIAASASDTSYVRGPIEKIGDEAFTFPVGDSLDYQPISITAPTDATHAFKAEYLQRSPNSAGYSTWIRETPNLEHVSICEYWILDRTAGASNVSVTITWDENSCGVTDLTKLRVARWDGSEWKDEGNSSTTGDTATGTITSNAVSSFSPFTLSTSDASENPLPVSLLSFSGQSHGYYNQLTWSTGSELNNDYFAIERSPNGEKFTEIGKVKGAGSSYQIKHYGFKDLSPMDGTMYYRLKQVDYDGTFEYSSMVSVTRETEVNEFLLGPNPANNYIIVQWGQSTEPPVKMELFDLTGRQVMQFKFDPANNHYKQLIDISNLTPGSYFVRFSKQLILSTEIQHIQIN